MYILNEKDFIRELLISKSKPKDISIGYLATLIAKYYFYNCDTPEELSGMVKDKLKGFDIPGYQEYKYHSKILGICKGLFNKHIPLAFREQDYIPIYENELKVVESLQSDRQKKLMFTFFALARYADCDGWINKKTSRDMAGAFKLANISVPSDKRGELLYELHEGGYISYAKKIDNLNLRVELDDSGEIVYRITEFQNLGNQYIGNFKPGYKQCERCGRPIKITGNRKKYCKKCAEEVKLEQMKEANLEMRNSKT